MSDVSGALGVRMVWAWRFAEACAWSKWANPIHVSATPPTDVLTSKTTVILTRFFV